MDKDEKKESRSTKTKSAFLKLLECPVCFERICPPVSVCINGHGVCKDCRKHLITCPQCKASFSQYKNTMIDQIIEESVFLCKYSERGCAVELKYLAMEEHEKKFCQHRTLECVLNKRGTEEQCESQVPIWQYYIHVLREHPQETINFRIETQRKIDLSRSISQISILKNITTQKILLETIKLDLAAKKFYMVFQYIGLNDDSVVQLRIYNRVLKYKELVYKNICVPVGLSEEDLEHSERCLVLDTNLLRSFMSGDELNYTIKVDTIPKKWYQVIKDKINIKPLGIAGQGSSGS